MKTFLFTYKFLFVTLLSLPLALCSEDNEDTTQDFKPIEITFTEGLFTKCDQTVSIKNVGLTYRPISENETGANLYANNKIIYQKFNTTSNPIQEELVFYLKNKDIQKVTVYSLRGRFF